MRAAYRSVAITVLAALTLPFFAGSAAADTTSSSVEIKIEGLTPTYAVTAQPGDPTTIDLSGAIEGVRIEPTSCSYVPTATGALVTSCAGNDVTVDLAYDTTGNITARVTTGGSGPASIKRTYTLHCGAVWVWVGVVIYCYVTVSVTN